jgi:tight adherence protein C
MSLMLLLSLAGLFVCVAIIAAFATSQVLSWAAPERKRLRDLAYAGPTGVLRHEAALTDSPGETLGNLSRLLPKSPREMGRLRRQLAAAGRYDLQAAAYYSAAKFGGPVVLALLALLTLGLSEGWMLALVGALLGYVLPDFIVKRMAARHAKRIENGLPDALDLLIICIEAGSSLDQSIVKASDELAVSHPALASELRMVTTEIRAGKPRLEAFRNFAERTQVEDVRSLVTMLVQTDRFGTSIAQALRVHADTSRTKRRQRAEERAAKIGVKLVFPLVLCIFPAVYIVCIGPAVIAVYRAFF